MNRAQFTKCVKGNVMECNNGIKRVQNHIASNYNIIKSFQISCRCLGVEHKKGKK